VNRRDFLKAPAAAVFPYIARSTVLGANDRVTLGFIGVGNRARWMLKNEDFGFGRVVAMADIWPQSFAETIKVRPDASAWTQYSDHRRMFDKENLDAVFVETPTHPRVLVSIHAIQGGLDVYAEKPLTLTVEEGRVLTKFVRRYNRVLQTGTQQRSMPINRYANSLVSGGKIGKIKEVIACNFLAPRRWQPLPEQPVPEGLNWDKWCDQAELRPYHPELHRGWPKWWDYDGGGQSWGVTGWGTHSLDQVQAALGKDDTGPVEMWPEQPGPEGRVTMRYDNGTLLKLEQPIIKDHQQLGAIFVGTKGRIQIIRGDFHSDPPELKKGAPDVLPEGPGEVTPHISNFIECIKSRQRPTADVEIAHRATTVCHLVNITRELGRKLRWDPKAERFHDDDEANALLSRPRRKGYELPNPG